MPKLPDKIVTQSEANERETNGEPAIPGVLRPYTFHGVGLSWAGKRQAEGTCPFCTRDKFTVKVESGLWWCWGCSEKDKPETSGNAMTFLRRLWGESDRATSDYAAMAKDRKLLDPMTLSFWGACRSLADGTWMLPAFNAEGSMIQLYRYVKHLDKSGKWRMILMPTPNVSAKEDEQHPRVGLFGRQLWLDENPIVYICEGPWDGMALWEVLRSTKQASDGSLTRTASTTDNLLAKVNVLAVPSCTTWRDAWNVLLEDRDLVLMFDNDHPREHPMTGELIAPAGYAGMQRVSRILSEGAKKPRSVSYLRWSSVEGGTHDSDRPSGYDVRDLLTGR
jgi:hypothetical protein